MGLFKTVLASCVRAGREQGRQRHRSDAELSTARAVITRLAAVAALLAVAILVMDTAGERYERQLATNAVAATRQ